MKISQRVSIAILIACICGLSWAKGKDTSQPLPKGWRLPHAQELKDSWRKSDSSHFSSFEGDFDGDNQLDTAKLLVNEKSKDFGIFVWWGKEKNTPPLEVYREVAPTRIHTMGISIAKPGKHKTACGKGYFECNGEPTELKMRNDGIEYFKNESASSIFYWDKKKNTFVRVWISD